MEGLSKLTFTVFGTPAPQGSMKAFMPKGGRFPVVTADNSKTKPWRQQVAGTALAEIARTGWEPKQSGPVFIEASFYFEKPKSAKKSEISKTTKPDLDKCARAILDSLTGIAFKDDAQVTSLLTWKGFGSPARVEIGII
jgi:crossover junction endodeoxyribonuclease RusA